MTKPAQPIVVRPKRPPGVLICAKCVRKVDGGRSLQKAFKAGLAERAEHEGRRPGRLIETRCLGVCPKRAVTVASGASLGRGELLVVGTVADVPVALERLLG